MSENLNKLEKLINSEFSSKIQNSLIENKELLIEINEKFKILSIDDLQKRALRCLKFMDIEFQKLSLKNDIQSRVRNDLDQQQREYYLHQQMKTIQEELGGHSQEEEIEELRKRASKKLWSDKVQDT